MFKGIFSFAPQIPPLPHFHFSKMKFLQSLLVALTATSTAVVSAVPADTTILTPRPPQQPTNVNPFLGKDFYANKGYAKKLEETISKFAKQGDFLNAAKARTVQKVGTFVWISRSADVGAFDANPIA